MENNKIQELKIEYVLFERERDNEYLKNLKVPNENLRKIKRTQNGVIMEEFYDFSKYKNIKNLQELSDALKDDEYLAIALDEKTREMVNPNNIISYITHITVKEEPKREMGEKIYLVKYKEFSLNGLGKDLNLFNQVQVIMNEDGSCNWDKIDFNGDSTKELDERLAFTYGGFSGIYYLADKEVIKKYADNYYELTKMANGWDFIKLKNEKTK